MEDAEQRRSESDVGARLRAARDAAGLSIAEVAQVTRVNARHLAAIEAGNFADLPAGPYSVGFVKAFARTVGLDSAETSAEFRREWDRSGTAPVAAIRYEPADPSRLPSAMLAWTAALVAIVILASYGVWRSGMFTGQSQEERMRVAAAAEPAPPVAAASNRPASAAPATPPAPASATATGPVLLTAIEPAWIRVYERDGATLFQGELSAGQNYEVPAAATDPLIRLGRPEALRVSVAGREVPPLGPPARTVKDVSLKGDALLARAAATAPTAPVAAPPGASSGAPSGASSAAPAVP